MLPTTSCVFPPPVPSPPLPASRGRLEYSLLSVCSAHSSFYLSSGEEALFAPQTWVPTLRPLLPRLAGVTLAFPGAPCRVLTGPSGDCSCQGPACFVLNVVCGFCLSPRCPLRMSLSYDGAGSSPELAAKPTRRSPLPQRAVSMLPWLTGEPWLGGDAWVWTHSQLPLGPAPSQVECPHVPTQKMG